LNYTGPSGLYLETKRVRRDDPDAERGRQRKGGELGIDKRERNSIRGIR